MDPHTPYTATRRYADVLRSVTALATERALMCPKPYGRCGPRRGHDVMNEVRIAGRTWTVMRQPDGHDDR